MIHCAASIEFDLPVIEAAEANIGASLNVLAFAKSCTRLQQMVAVSTAYVAPHPGGGGECEEELVELPRPAQVLYDALRGGASQDTLLRETGHPNTYTYTKCLSEHLVTEQRGSVPLTIVRPSIVSASWQYPKPGWIDSNAAFAGFVGLIGAGHLRAIVGNRKLSDIVPCDVVAESCGCSVCIEARIKRTCVTWPKRTIGVGLAADVISSCFKRHPIGRPRKSLILDPITDVFVWSTGSGTSAGSAVQMWLRMSGKKRQIRRVAGLVDKLKYATRHLFY